MKFNKFICTVLTLVTALSALPADVVSARGTHLIPPDENGFIRSANALMDYVGNESIIYVPDDVTHIDSLAFYNHKVDTIVLPKSVEYIAANAFDFINTDGSSWNLVVYNDDVEIRQGAFYRVPKPTIYCNPGSSAAHVAEGLGYPFRYLDDVTITNTTTVPVKTDDIVGSTSSNINDSANITKNYRYRIKNSNCFWCVTDEGVLQITGSGDPNINATSPSDIPWIGCRFEIKSVELEETVTPKSMAYWFWNFTELDYSPIIPEGVENTTCMFESTPLKKFPNMPSSLKVTDGMFYHACIEDNNLYMNSLPDSRADMLNGASNYTIIHYNDYTFTKEHAEILAREAMYGTVAHEKTTNPSDDPNFVASSVINFVPTTDAVVMSAPSNTHTIEGTDVNWSISDGTLKITGNGDPKLALSRDDAPWWNERNYINRIEIEDTVTPFHMFGYFRWLTSLKEAPTIPSSVKGLNDTFLNCTSLEKATVPETVMYCSNTFNGCASLKEVYIYSDLQRYDNMLAGVGTEDEPCILYYGGDCTEELAFEIARTGNNVGVASIHADNGLTIFPVNNETVGSSNTTVTGKQKFGYGESDCYWEITDEGVLEITGTGSPDDGYYNRDCTYLPWCSRRDEIKSIYIEDSVKPTCMGFWFEGCSNLEEAPPIPESVTMTYNLFKDCTSLKGDVYVSSNIKSYSGMFDNAGNANNTITLHYGGDCTRDLAKKLVENADNVKLVDYADSNMFSDFPNELEIKVGETIKLYTADLGKYCTLSFSSLYDGDVTSVADDGTITGLKVGSDRVVMNINTPSGTAGACICIVTVKDNTPAVSGDSIEFNTVYKGAPVTPNETTSITKLETVKLTSVKSKSKSKIKLVWKATDNCSGYEISYSKSSKFNNAKTVKVSNSAKTTTSLKKLKSNKKYYIRVRSYLDYNGSITYGNWSNMKSCKVK